MRHEIGASPRLVRKEPPTRRPSPLALVLGTVRVKTVATWLGEDKRVVKTCMPETAPEPYMTMTDTRRP
jgi:hypothetical protein